MKLLLAGNVGKAEGYSARLASYISLGRITEEQPSTDEGVVAMSGDALRELQKMQIKVAFAKGTFTANSEIAQENIAFLKTLKPSRLSRHTSLIAVVFIHRCVNRSVSIGVYKLVFFKGYVHQYRLPQRSTSTSSGPLSLSTYLV